MLVVDRNNEATELYDLSNDLSQNHNLIDKDKYTDTIDRLCSTFLKYNDHNDATVTPRTTEPYRVTNV